MLSVNLATLIHWRWKQNLTKTRLLAVVIVVAGVIAAIFVGLIRAQASADKASALRAENEYSAIQSLRIIGAAEARYHQRCGGYANLRELMRIRELPAAQSIEGSTVTTDGYKITIETEGFVVLRMNPSSDCTGSVGADFFSHADPIELGRTGTRYYASDSRHYTNYSHSDYVVFQGPTR